MENEESELPPRPTHTQLSMLFEDVLHAVDHVKANKAEPKVLCVDDPVYRLIGWGVEALMGENLYGVYFSASITALKSEAARLPGILTPSGRRDVAEQLARGINPLAVAEPEQKPL